MIAHNIIVHKPLVLIPSGQKPTPRFTQEELDKYNTASLIQRGMYVKYNTVTEISSTYQIFYVCELITKLEELTYNYKGYPNNIKILNLGGPNVTDIKRFDTSQDYVPLNDEEMAAYITNNALLLHRIEQATR